jgi:hypothetical protein
VFDTVSQVDGQTAGTCAASVLCSDTANFSCYRLHNGGIFWLRNNESFVNTTSTNLMEFGIDPDGIFTNKKDSLFFNLHFNGRITTWGAEQLTTESSYGTFVPAVCSDPPWFSWN